MSGPVFVSGLSGTGKTQLRLALEADRRLAVFRKTYLWKTVRGRFGDLSQVEDLDAALAAIAAEEGSAPSPDGVGPVDADHPYEHLFAAHYRRRAEALGRSRWGVQMGGLEEFAGEILEALPDARFVHLLSDPHHHLASHVSGRRRLAPPGPEARRWLRSARVALDHLEHPRWMTVRTPDLAHDPAGVVGTVARFLEVDLPEDAVGGIDFGQLVVERRHAFRRLPSDVTEAAQVLGFAPAARRGPAMGLRHESREGRSA